MSQHVGKISLFSLLFYGLSLLVLIAIPITVRLVQVQKHTIVPAAVERSGAPPSIQIKVTPHDVRVGEKITIRVRTTNANRYRVFFLREDVGRPVDSLVGEILTEGDFDKTRLLNLVQETSQGGEFFYLPAASGYLTGVAYQLQESFGQPSSGDLMCAWDGNLYIFRKNFSNPTRSLRDMVFNRKTKITGVWESLTNCENSEPVKVAVF